MKGFFVKRVTLLFAIGLVAGLGLFYVLQRLSHPKVEHKAEFGMTFSTKYATSLRLDWKEVLTAMLDDLKIRKLRIPAYWDDIEKSPGVYDWSELDWIMAEAEARGAEVTLVIGRKVPRWPECHEPDWVEALSPAQQQQRTLKLLEAEVTHFKDAPAVKIWQVENEPLFQFGHCPPPDREFLKKEVELVKRLDPSRPVQITDSGELSTWIRTASLGDQLGISMYRLVWNEYLGELYWPVSPFYYTERMNAISPVVKRVIVSELQAEPWFRKGIFDTPIDEQIDSMNVDRLADNLTFAERTGVSEIYLWGGEWWYWVRGQGRPEFWEMARTLYH